MNLPSMTIRVEVAKVGNSFLIRHHTDYGQGSMEPEGLVFLRSREELQAWFANMEIKVR